VSGGGFRIDANGWGGALGDGERRGIGAWMAVRARTCDTASVRRRRAAAGRLGAGAARAARDDRVGRGAGREGTRRLSARARPQRSTNRRPPPFRTRGRKRRARPRRYSLARGLRG